MRVYLRFILVLGFVFFLQFVSEGQVPDMEFSDPFDDIEFDKEEMKCIVQDTYGFIWIGTNDGLYCFDGGKLKKYNFNFKDTTSLVNDNVICLFIDNIGDLWIGTRIGLCVYDRDKDNFKWIASIESDAGISSLYISSLCEDNENNLYVAGSNGICRYLAERNTFEKCFEIGSGLIKGMLFDTNNNLWVAADADGGLTCYNLSEDRVLIKYNQGSGANSLSGNDIRDIVIQNDSLLWIAVYGGGVNVLNMNTSVVKKYIPALPYERYFFSLYVDANDDLWTCDFSGLKFYDKQNDSFFGYYPNVEDKTSIKESAVGIMQDKQGNYWTLHKSGGVCLRYVSKGFDKYINNQDKRWHTSKSNITAIEVADNGNWWIGNGVNGIDVFDFKYGDIKTYVFDPDNPYSIGQGAVACLEKDRNGVVWVGSNFGGLQYFDEQNGRFYSYVHNPLDSNSIANNDVRAITEDNEGDIWVCTHGAGVDRFNKKENKFVHYNVENSALSNVWTFSALFDSNNNLWVTTAWGLNKLEKGAQTFTNYYFSSSDTNSIPDNFTNYIFEDSKKQLWLGTVEGLCKYLPESDNFERIQLDGENRNIFSIEEEKNGHFWISSKLDILEFDPIENKLVNIFDASSGLQDGVFNRRTSCKNGDQLFFGGQGGLSVFEPEKIKLNTAPPVVYITNFYLFNKLVDSYGEGSVLQKSIFNTNEIELAYNQNTIGFEFTATNFINYKQNKFKYKLEGIDQDWVDIGNERKVVYSHLPHGEYVFKVMASNNDNVWSEKAKNIKITIHNPWWYSWWFKTITAVALLVLFMLFVKWRTAVLEKEKKLLENKVRKRTKSLYEKNELLNKQKHKLKTVNALLSVREKQILQQSERLQIFADNLQNANGELVETNATKDKLFSIIAHDLISPFNVILGFSEELSENYYSMDNDERVSIIGYLHESSKNAFSLLQNLLHWSRSQKGNIKFAPVVIEIENITDRVLEEVSFFAMKKNIQIHLDFKSNFKVKADPDMLTLIFRNLLINAIKFSNEKSQIVIGAEPTGDHILFSVRDQGIGMENAKAESLFSFNEHGSTVGTGGEKGTGLGLVLCRDFIQLHKGKIWAESLLGEGSTILFTIPQSSTY